MDPDLAALIRQRLPPNLEVLLVESLTLPVPAIAGVEQVIARRDMEAL